MGKNLIKILDKRVADTLLNGGFFYVEEIINNKQTIYVFQDTEELRSVLEQIEGSGEFEDVVIVEDDTLCF